MSVYKFSKFKIRAFTIIELMVMMLVLVILASTAYTSMESYIFRSRTSEAFMVLGRIANSQALYYTENGRYIATGPTNLPPSRNPTLVNFSADPAANWNSIGISITDAVRFGYQCYSNGSDDDYNCEAQGDLDGDGDTSIFQMHLTVNDRKPNKSTVMIFDELE